MFLVDEGLNHLDDFRHHFCDPWIVVGTENIQFVHGVVVVFDISVGNLQEIDAFLTGCVDDFVIDVGEVLDINHSPPARFQPTMNQIEGDVTSGVSKMRGRVWCDATDIHVDLARTRGFKRSFLACSRIIHV